MLLSKPELLLLAIDSAIRLDLDPALVCAHIDARSRWDSGLAVTLGSELPAASGDPLECSYRQTIWGLMALSGEFARFHNFHGPLSSLIEPEQNLQEGCRILKQLLLNPAGQVDALFHWNHQPEPDLVAQTLAKVGLYRELIARRPLALHTFPDAGTTPPPVHSPQTNSLEVSALRASPTRNQP